MGKHWLIRKGFNDSAYLSMIESIVKLGYEYTLIDTIPFSKEYDVPDLPLDSVIVYGGQGFIEYGKNKGYGGVFFNDNFNVKTWLDNWKDEVLNYDSIIGTIGDIQTDLQKFFIRPLHDNKKFSGQIMNLSDFNHWKYLLSKIDGYSTVDLNTEIVISSIKNIVVEYRIIVVDGKYITGSEYKRADRVAYFPFVPEYVQEYVDELCSKWTPDTAFCLDIAEVEIDGVFQCKILEVNCVNGIGLYCCDTDKYVNAISSCF